MNTYKKQLVLGGILCFVLGVFQGTIGFYPSLSLYFGAPEALVKNKAALIAVSLLLAVGLGLFGLLGLSGAGVIRKLPLLKQGLAGISSLFILRGLLLFPEILVLTGILNVPIPVAPRFVCFSAAALCIGILFMSGTAGGWHFFSMDRKNRRPD